MTEGAEHVGHAPRGIMARHYIQQLTAVTPAEKEELEKAMTAFRESIVNEIDLAIGGRVTPPVLKNFEPEDGNPLADSK